MRGPSTPAVRQTGSAGTEGSYHRILAQLRDSTGVDFSLYRESVVRDRIQRRMLQRKVERIEEYVPFLREDPDEARSLHESVLAGTAGFHRDHETVASLKRAVFPALCRNIGRPIRIWVPGCSSGEEVCSIAIALLEFMGDAAKGARVQIFATDVSVKVIETARAGIYDEVVTAGLPGKILRRYFVKVDGGHRICKQVRDLCIFARQDVTRDPPFSRLDLISSRNVFLYLSPVVQAQVLPVFHYALSPDRFLLLGPSKGIVGLSDHFRRVERDPRILVKKAMPVRFGFDGAPLSAVHAASGPPLATQARRRESEAQRELDRILLARYAPAGVVVNETLDIVQFRGNTAPFLAPAPGGASVNLLDMARKGLRGALEEAMRKARATRRAVRRQGVPYLLDDERGAATIEVLPAPMPGRAAGGSYYLVNFDPEPAGRDAPPRRGRTAAAPGRESEADRLRQELGESKAYLNAVIEELKAINEEQKASNEEVLCSNEELQSSVEKLGAAGRQLELAKVELARQNRELARINNDLTHAFTGVTLPIVILGSDLKIRRFTPASGEILNLLPGDVGRRITDIKPNLAFVDLESMLLEGCETEGAREATVQDAGGRWYSLRVRPCRTPENRIDGVVMTLLDVTELLQTKRRVGELQGHLLHLRDEEQRRIARDLHDSTAQQLTAIAINLQLLGDALPDAPPDTLRRLQESQDLAQQCSRELRDICSLLHPPLLDDLGLPEAVRWYVESFSRRTGIEISLNRDEIPRHLPKEVERAIFRIVQETLSNVHRHSGSPVAEIRIAQTRGEVSVRVRDRGRGFPVPGEASRPGAAPFGVGIAGMRERTQQLGGRFRIMAGENGTTVQVRIPLTGVDT